MPRRPASNGEVRRRPDKQQPPPGRGGGRQVTQEEAIVHAGPNARERLRALDHQLRNATACHLAGMDLARYYRGGLLDVRLGELLAWGRWAA